MIPIIAASIAGLVVGLIAGFALGAFCNQREDAYHRTISEDLKRNLTKATSDSETQVVTTGSGTRMNPFRSESHLVGCPVIVGGECNCGEVLSRRAV